QASLHQHFRSARHPHSANYCAVVGLPYPMAHQQALTEPPWTGQLTYSPSIGPWLRSELFMILESASPMTTDELFSKPRRSPEFHCTNMLMASSEAIKLR